MSDLKSVTEASFEADVTLNSRPVLIDFWAEWCGPCKALAPTLEKVARNFEGKVDVVKINVDEHPAFRERFGVRGIPALVLMTGSQELGRIVGPRSATQLASYLDAHLGTATQLAKPELTLCAFGGDAQAKAARIAHLREYLEEKQASPDTPMWPEKVSGALAFVVGSADPDECASTLGIPTDVVEAVNVLSSYRGTHFNGALFVADWLESVPVGANLSRLPGRLLTSILSSQVVSDMLNEESRLLAIRDELVSLQAAETDGAPLPDAKWADLKEACNALAGELGEGNAARAAAVLKVASSSLARNPDMFKDLVFAVTGFVWKSLQAKCNWSPADDSRFMKLADGIYKHALETGVEPPRGSAMSKQVAEIDPQLVERFLSHYEKGHRALGERGRAIGDMLIQLTGRIA
ncbi:thioredoxin [Paraburkholderia phenoliruptrix]|uniref:thioredoxin n=1 Tax=Paraburkholderia phenoliruptrix TaxID=252970 RepID=UPI002869C13E|nr:thioredoxin [Paraburkholderia phenoliruptrix]WMY12677.1 thioredoxin [Paraburkholderia phenoliruptrix]